MNAVSNDPLFERLDSAAASVRYALTLLQQAQAEKDADLMGCSVNEAEKALTLAAADLQAVGASI